MKLVAEAGSTKIHWGIINHENIYEFETSGFNPNVSDRNYLRQLLVSGFPSEFNPIDIKQIIYYGTGCSSKRNKDEVKRALTNFFIQSKITIYTDLEAVGLAIFNNNKGFVGIMGTGSSFGYYENNKIIEQSPSLGYLLGDQGAGAHMGKVFLKKLLSNELPQKLSNDIRKEIGKEDTVIIKELYSSKVPNAYMAGFLPVLKAFLHEKQIHEIVEDSIQQYINTSILPLLNKYGDNAIGIVGGVAVNFSKQVNQIFIKNNLSVPILLNQTFNQLLSVNP